ncbi:LutC/YkgG family protein [Minwuia sp.]|uniref:LutC/YkgG family protein n=1 Tax=Minwuia sp. TaxID=2493630 RepID=UPI003A8CFEAC
MSTRDTLFAKIAAASADNPERGDADTLRQRMREHRINLMPARADKPEAVRLDLFLEKCEELSITYERLSHADDVPGAVADYLKQRNLPTGLRVSPAPEIAGLPWERAPLLDVRTGSAEITDQVSVTPAVAGIAETGTLMMASGSDTPATLNFVPDNHIVVLRRSQIVRGMEDAFAMVRERFGEGQMPRTVNLVSGPSRTGDVEQKIVMGAHGPRRLHILLINDLD